MSLRFSTYSETTAFFLTWYGKPSKYMKNHARQSICSHKYTLSVNKTHCDKSCVTLRSKLVWKVYKLHLLQLEDLPLLMMLWPPCTSFPCSYSMVVKVHGMSSSVSHQHMLETYWRTQDIIETTQLPCKHALPKMSSSLKPRSGSMSWDL